MPIYEYVCKACDHQFDALQKIADAPLIDCPECNKAELRKKISAPSFRLKGQGWYETDFKKDNRRNLADGDSASASKPADGAAKGEGKSESKSESKADSKSESKTPAPPAKVAKSDGGKAA